MTRIASILAAFALTTTPAVAGDQKTPVHGEKLMVAKILKRQWRKTFCGHSNSGRFF